MSLVVFIILLAAFSTAGYFFLKKLHGPKITPEYPYRMLVAVRRRLSGMERYHALDAKQQADYQKKLSQQWQELNKDWQEYGVYSSGFSSMNQALSSGNENDWLIFMLYDIPDYGVFQKCLSLVDAGDFSLLKNHCDIRLILSEKTDVPETGIRSLL